MLLNRIRLWALVFLLLIYLVGILILSGLSFSESKKGIFLKGTSLDISRQQITRERAFEFGLPGLRPPLRRSKINWCSDLRYLDPPGKTIALASFPGSGNTWLRYLLQQTSGYYTGSVYKDYGLLKNGFPAENVSNGSVLVVKTHEWGSTARSRFSKAVLLVRSPAAAIQAEFNRQSGGHIGFASPDRYKRLRGRYWHQFVNDKLKGWQQMNLDWLYNFTGPTHIIFYEQLVNSVENTVKSIMDFIGEPIDPVLFQCALERKEGIYRRKKRFPNFDPFTDSMKASLNDVQEQVYQAIYNYATPDAR